MTTISRIVHADLQMQCNDRYHRVPFHVPPGTESIGVHIWFERDSAVIDLGCESPTSWRGWSGGARDQFTISASEATPGYLPGPIDTGEWAVVLGLHKLPIGFADIRVEISMPSTVELPSEPDVVVPEPIRRGSSRDLPAPPGLRWFAGDLHNHTVHSDGKRTVNQLAKLGVEMGLDFLGVADHNTVSHHPYLKEAGEKMGITLIPAQEVTTHRGHANVYGDIGWIDFRQPTYRWQEEAKKRGGIFSINHPIDADCGWLDELPEAPDSVEAWHASWYRDLKSDGILSWIAALGGSQIIIGGSDFHSDDAPQRPGTPTTWVAATDSSVDSLLEGIKAGRTMITGSGHYDGKVLTPKLFDVPTLVRVSERTMIAVDASGCVLVSFDGKRQLVTSKHQEFRLPITNGPYILVTPDGTVLAMSL